jgi:hypothetical protein
MLYEIIIKGYLNGDWFEDLQMSQLEDHTTKLRGAFVDQAALYGVLRRIQDLGIELVAVNAIEEDGVH